ncbi:hypothetical protein I552_9746 [Mycobacterium xenopi 3993]|nr:hypothetical protein I552_9746 [Mycobacterium xenopi 3993]
MRQQLTTAAPRHNQQQRNTLQERKTTKMDFTCSNPLAWRRYRISPTPSWVCSGQRRRRAARQLVDTLSIGAGAALISVLTSIVSYKIAGQKTSTASGE